MPCIFVFRRTNASENGRTRDDEGMFFLKKPLIRGMICDFNNIKATIQEEGLQILIVSYGGSCTNTLLSALTNNGYTCLTKTYRDILCHCPHYIEIDIPIIYIYDNPIKSLLSMKRRGIPCWGSNQQKMRNNLDVELSDEHLLKCMIHQFHSFTETQRENVFVIKSCELFEESIVKKLEHFLQKQLVGFPITFVKPATDITNITDTELRTLFEKYSSEIDAINNHIC